MAGHGTEHREVRLESVPIEVGEQVQELSFSAARVLSPAQRIHEVQHAERPP